MRVVLDTNILARAVTGPTGPAAETLRLIGSAGHVLVLSPFLLSELTRVLGYERLRRSHGWDDAAIARYVANLHDGALVVEPSIEATPAVVPHDPQDDPVVATAITGNADVLCTLDRHIHHPAVVAFCAAHAVRVLTDVALLTELRATIAAPTATEPKGD